MGLDHNTPIDAVAEKAVSYGSANKLAGYMTSELVKGVSYARGGQQMEYREEVLTKAVVDAQVALSKAVARSHPQTGDRAGVIKGLAPDFQSMINNANQYMGVNSGISDFVHELNGVLADLGRDITLQNPLTSGLVPFDLLAPSMLLYPVYSPFRNKLPRVQGMGTSRRAKLITGISGSRTGSGTTGAPFNWSIAELPGGGSTIPGSSWPMQLPAAGATSSVDLNVPYKFFGITEPISWLAQFAGQGFEDISSLANLLLLQKAMLAEEYQLFGACAAALAQPAAPTLTKRAAGSNETALTGVTTNVYVVVTANTPFGETAYAVGNALSTNPSNSQVIDVLPTVVTGALTYNIYAATGTGNPGRTGFFYAGTTAGGLFTLQGALPAAGNNPPAADTGSGSSLQYDGLASILSGNASGTYSTGAGYYNAQVNEKAKISLFNTAFEALWSKTKADPAEVVMEGTDLGRLSDDIRSSTSNTNYRLFIAQSEAAAVLAGAAVAEVLNPVTRRPVPIMVHPWLPQGNAMIMSYSMPFPWSNVTNIWEVVNVQDYMSIAWPVIDVTFRYSMFLYGSLVGYAPVYCGFLQGLQISDTTPYA